MSKDISSDNLPTAFEIDEIFGEGDKAKSLSIWNYLFGSITKPNTIAHKLSNDSKLYRHGWLMVLLAGAISLLSEFGLEYYAHVSGWTSVDQINENMLYAAIGLAVTILAYPLVRWVWVWVFVFRFGTEFADRRIAAATALGFGLGCFLSPLTSLLQALVLSTSLPIWVPGDNLYDQASTFAIIPSLLFSTIIPGLYFRDVLDIDLLKAIAWYFLSFVLIFGSLLLPFIAYFIAIQ